MALTGWLWRFVAFRYAVVLYVRWGLPGHQWLAVNTPFAFVVRALFERMGGHSSEIAAIDGWLRADAVRRGVRYP